VSDWEFGVEWRPDPAVEITLQYHNMNRNDVTRAPFNRFSSDVLRLQVQLNY
jgi:phosphate-selective porin